MKAAPSTYTTDITVNEGLRGIHLDDILRMHIRELHPRMLMTDHVRVSLKVEEL